MGKATQRRERRLAKDLRALLNRNSNHFIRVWNRYLKGWCGELVASARNLGRGEKGTSSQSMHDIMEKANRLLQMIGDEAERMVGAQTRQTLNHEYCKAVARATDHRIYLFDTDSVHRLMMSKPKKKRL